MKGRSILELLLFALSAPALAGGIYKCASGDGVTSYVSKRLPGARCTLVRSYSARPARAVPKPDAQQATAQQVAMVAKVADTPDATPALTSAAAFAPAAPAASPPRVVRGQVYSYVGKDGVRTYASVRPRGVPIRRPSRPGSGSLL